jgi:hypothetical protein
MARTGRRNLLTEGSPEDRRMRFAAPAVVL